MGAKNLAPTGFRSPHLLALNESLFRQYNPVPRASSVTLLFLYCFVSPFCLKLPFYSLLSATNFTTSSAALHSVTQCRIKLPAKCISVCGLIKTWRSPTTSLSLSLEQNLNNRPCSCSELYCEQQENHTPRYGFHFWSIIAHDESSVFSTQISPKGMSSCYPPCHANFAD